MPPAELPPSAPPAPPPGPVEADQRIVALDVVRGIAVLGILVMNVVEFAWPLAAYTDPTAGGGDTGGDLWTWYAQQALFDGRMRALFSMLFGAGIALIAERLERQGRGSAAADLLLRRCLWLVPFGLLHRFLLQWTGDILYMYGLLGAIAVAFRRLRPRTQLLCGLLLLASAAPIEAWHYHQASEQRAAAAAAVAVERDGGTPTAAQAQARKSWERRSAPPPADAHADELAAIRGGYTSVFAYRWNYHHTFQSAYLYYYFVWDVLGMMLIGMGLGRLGFFAGAFRPAAYRLWLVAGALAAAVSLWLAQARAADGFAREDLELHAVTQAVYPAVRLCGGLGWAALAILVLRRGALPRATAALAAVGRMAFSNYVLQTVCCTLLFFGYGFGLYGELSRAALMLVVIGVSALQLLWSPLWLRAFRFGPLEWAWRSLTWWRRQPFRA